MNLNPEFEDDEYVEEFGLSIEQMEEVAYANMLQQMSQTDSVLEAKEWAATMKQIMETRIVRLTTDNQGYGN